MNFYFFVGGVVVIKLKISSCGKTTLLSCHLYFLTQPLPIFVKGQN